jgi:hypothetical protein
MLQVLKLVVGKGHPRAHQKEILEITRKEGNDLQAKGNN